MKLIKISLLCLFLAGCSSAYKLGTQALEKGDNKTAEGFLRVAVQRGENGAWNNFGVALARQGKSKEAIEAYTMGARQGDTNAQRNLANRNIPLPPMDLLPVPTPSYAKSAPEPTSSGDSTAGVAAFLGVLNSVIEGRNAARSQALSDPWPSSNTITCESRDTSMGRGMNGTVFTTCR